MVILYIALIAAALALLTAFICYRITFYAKPAKPLGPDEYNVPRGKAYDSYHDQMIAWQKEVRALSHQDFSIQSHDGLTLWGKYYEFAPGAPIELMFHGYRGSAERDLCGGVQRCFALGRSILLVDQRTAGRSGGHTISFGVNEHKDCLAWVDFMIRHFGPDVKIILTGISMGASTVALAAGQDLPKNVVGVLADCGYHSGKAIICKCADEMHLPGKLVYPFIRLGAMLFGGFDPNLSEPAKALQSCRLPVIFFHGESDDFVPCHMSRIMAENCAGPSRLVTVPGAVHGLSYIVQPQWDLQEVADFFTENGVPTQVLTESREA